MCKYCFISYLLFLQVVGKTTLWEWWGKTRLITNWNLLSERLKVRHYFMTTRELQRQPEDPKHLSVSVEKDVTHSDLEQFVEEVANMIKLDHPNILSLLGVSSHEGKLCMICPLMKNKDMKQYLLKKRTVSVFFLVLSNVSSCEEQLTETFHFRNWLNRSCFPLPLKQWMGWFISHNRTSCTETWQQEIACMSVSFCNWTADISQYLSTFINLKYPFQVGWELTSKTRWLWFEQMHQARSELHWVFSSKGSACQVDESWGSCIWCVFNQKWCGKFCEILDRKAVGGLFDCISSHPVFPSGDQKTNLVQFIFLTHSLALSALSMSLFHFISLSLSPSPLFLFLFASSILSLFLVFCASLLELWFSLSLSLFCSLSLSLSLSLSCFLILNLSLSLTFFLLPSFFLFVSFFLFLSFSLSVLVCLYLVLFVSHLELFFFVSLFISLLSLCEITAWVHKWQMSCKTSLFLIHFQVFLWSASVGNIHRRGGSLQRKDKPRNCWQHKKGTSSWTAEKSNWQHV